VQVRRARLYTQVCGQEARTYAQVYVPGTNIRTAHQVDVEGRRTVPYLIQDYISIQEFLKTSQLPELQLDGLD